MKSKARFESRPKLAPIPEKTTPSGDGTLTQSEKEAYGVIKQTTHNAGNSFGQAPGRFERNNNIEIWGEPDSVVSYSPPPNFDKGEFVFDKMFIHEPDENDHNQLSPRVASPSSRGGIANGHLISDGPLPYTDISNPLPGFHRRGPYKKKHKRRKFCIIICVVIAMVTAAIGVSAVAVWLTSRHIFYST